MRPSPAVLAALLVSGFALPATAQSASQPGCLIERAWTVSFLQADSSDTVTVTAIGPDCARASVLLVVRDAEGVIIHDDVWPIAWLDVTEDDRAAAARAIEGVAPSTGRLTSELPDYDALDGERETALIDRDNYALAKSAAAGLLCYGVTGTDQVCAVFDPGAGRGVAIYEAAR